MRQRLAAVGERDACLPQRQGRRVGRSAGTREQQQLGAVRIESKRNTGEVSGLNEISRFRLWAAGFRIARYTDK